MGLKPRRRRPAGRPAGQRRAVRRGRGAPALSNHPQPPTWRAWRAQNGGKRWYWRAPLAIEWGLEWFVDRLRSLALFDLLELAGKGTVLIVAIFWVLEAGDRAKERHYRAWDLINSARGSTGDGGRIAALQDLNKDGVSLSVAPLEQAYLFRVDLRGADLVEANLQGANLGGANLQGARLWGANLQRANLGGARLDAGLWGEDARLQQAQMWHVGLWGEGANLQGAQFWHANLQEASLGGANLQGAKLQGANLQGADLSDANLQGADLWSANLQGAYLGGANLQGADLEGADLRGDLRGANLQGANLRGAYLEGADLRGATNLTQKQLDAAIGDDRTQLPDGLTRPTHWTKTTGPEAPPAPQPDDGGRAPAADGAPGSDK